jgi:hypothetical protein
MNRQRGVISEVYAEVQRQFEQWRSTQPSRSRLPESLWQSAVDLAKEHGVNPTAKALGLDYGGLRKRLTGSSGQRRKPVPAGFVELVAPRSVKWEECVIEFESARGSKMRVQWKASAPPDWPSLLRAWRDAER